MAYRAIATNALVNCWSWNGASDRGFGAGGSCGGFSERARPDSEYWQNVQTGSIGTQFLIGSRVLLRLL